MMIDAFENVRVERRYSKEDVTMNNVNVILKDAVAVWTSLNGGKKTRFERLVDGRWFDWGSRVSYDADWFKKALSKKTFGEEYTVEYVG